jgi:hypothetical protein
MVVSISPSSQNSGLSGQGLVSTLHVYMQFNLFLLEKENPSINPWSAGDRHAPFF